MLKPKKVMPWEEFNNLWIQNAEYSRGIGFEITRKNKDSPLTTTIKRISISFCIAVYTLIITGVALYEIYCGRRFIIKDFQFGMHMFGYVVFLSNAYIVYYYKEKLIDLFEWSEGIYGNFDGATWCEQEKIQIYRNSFKIVRLLQNVPYIVCLGLGGVALVLTYVTGEGYTPLLIYSTKGFYGKWFWFEIAFVICLIAAYLCYRIIIIYVTTFILLVQHCSGNYRILSCALRELKNKDQTNKDKSKILKTIQSLHAELLGKVGTLDEIFTYLLLMNALLSVIAFTLIGALYLSGEGDLPTVALGIFGGSLFILFPFFGQNIIGEADDFFLATYDSDWLELPLKEKKSLLLIMLMAVKPIGLSSGGFHFSNYQEITDIYNMTYQLLVMIKKIMNKS